MGRQAGRQAGPWRQAVSQPHFAVAPRNEMHTISQRYGAKLCRSDRAGGKGLRSAKGCKVERFTRAIALCAALRDPVVLPCHGLRVGQSYKE